MPKDSPTDKAGESIAERTARLVGYKLIKPDFDGSAWVREGQIYGWKPWAPLDDANQTMMLASQMETGDEKQALIDCLTDALCRGENPEECIRLFKENICLAVLRVKERG